jgi:hypothetical protein
MDRKIATFVVFLVVMAFGLAAQAQTPPPPTSINGSVVQVTGRVSGDPNHNGASIVNGTSASYNATNQNPANMYGSARVTGLVEANSGSFNVSHIPGGEMTGNYANYQGTGTANVALMLGRHGSGDVSLSGELAGGAQYRWSDKHRTGAQLRGLVGVRFVPGLRDIVPVA